MTGQYCVDANIFLMAWYSGYPIHVFNSLWTRLAEAKEEIIIIKPIFDEIEPISHSDRKLTVQEKRNKYPLRLWLEENQFLETLINEDVNALSLELEKKYEIHDTSKGAGQIDITLIAFAKIFKKIVITQEGEQKQKPEKKYNYKIPLICDEQGVVHLHFVDMLTKLNIRI